MFARAAVLVTALAAITITSAPLAQRLAQGRAAPAFSAAERWDKSPALRDLPRRPPRPGTLREAPRFRRAIGPKSIDPIVQSVPAPQLLAPPSLSFEGLGNLNAVLPPDTNGAVGPNHFVQWVNLSFAIYAKGAAGTTPSLVYGPAAGNTLWTGFGGPCETTNNGDPVVRYDHLADRWVMTQLALPNAYFGIYLAPFYECIAVSATPDPTGAYYRYQYSFNKLNDYPKVGVWPDAYYMSMNQFSQPFLYWAGQGVVAFDRAKMLAGQPAGMISFDLASLDLNLGGMLPSDLDGPPPPAGAPNVFVQIDDDAWGYAPDQLQLWKFHVDWTTPSLSSFTHAASLATAPFDSNLCAGADNCVPQPGTTIALDTLADRLMYRLQYRNFGDHDSLAVNHTVDADGTDHAGVRWYEIRDPYGAPAIRQQGTYAPDADHRWMASAAMDRMGNMAVGFSVSGATTYPSIRYAARLAGDPPGTLAQGETTLIAGSGSQTHASGRWGDYSMMTVDPADGCTFWYTQQYLGATSEAGWQTRVGAFNLPSCPAAAAAAPRVSVTAAVASAAEAGSVPGRFTISRSGDTSVPLIVKYAVTGSATAGSDYVPLGTTLVIPAGAASADVPVVPIDDLLVEPDESVALTAMPGDGYAVASPAGASVAIVSDDLPSDLVVSALTVPTAGGAGASLSVTDTTRNQGSGPALASTTAFYLSKDSVVSSGDAALGTRAVPELSPAASDSAATAVTIPAGTAAGSYYVIAVADAAAANSESQEGNNTRTAAITIGPDLVVSALTTPAAASAGGAIVASDSVTNRGGAPAPASTLSFFLSVNTSFDASDVPLGSRAVSELGAGASSSASTTLTIPAGATPGSYYVVAVADAGNVIGESLENNNTRAGAAMRIGPDLVQTGTTVSSTAAAGGPIVVGDTAKNQGGGDAGASTTAFFLSTTSVFNSSAVRIGSRAVPPLAAGATSTASTTLTLPGGLSTGNYYVFAAADADNAVAEAFESNNTSFAALVRVGPDLAVSALGVTPAVVAGASASVTSTIVNQGGGAAAGSTTRFYLSTNLSFDASDVLVGTRAVPPLSAGQADAGAASIVIPAGTAPGSYYLIAVADGGGAVAETNETNNTRAAVIVVSAPGQP